MAQEESYFPATRHPWPCFLFLLPLLLLYEVGVVVLGGMHPETLRNGADNWLRWGLGSMGVQTHYIAPVVLLLGFGIWSLRRREDRPRELFNVLTGMLLESVAFALGMWGVSRCLGPLIDYFGLELALAAHTEQALGQMVTFLGAGIYEETLFRLLLYTGLVWMLRRIDLPMVLTVGFAGLVSASFFAAAHHLGPYGEPFEGYAFLFRTVAGLYFALLYQVRGFGIAVGAHACYDVIVGVMII
jgi:hypothetical protein